VRAATHARVFNPPPGKVDLQTTNSLNYVVPR